MQSIDLFKSLCSIWQELSASCTVITNHLAQFFTTGMSSMVLDCWALEVQQFNIWFEHISGKKNVVANAISRGRTLGLYQDDGNTDLAKTDDNIVDNIIEELHATEWIPSSATCKRGKLNLDISKEAQRRDMLCIKKG